MEYIRWLQEVGREDVAIVGGKAATLGELAKAGFPVPDGFVLTTKAFAKFLSPEVDREERGNTITGTPLPGEIASALLEAVRRLGNTPLAVRSSAVAEDLADASFAGQYETVLGVEGSKALLEAVRRCWTSSFGVVVEAYWKARGSREPHSMAVLVQRMVPAEAAGVAFTANPVSGDRSEVLVSAVHGLGDRLVSGKVSPDEWVIRDGKAVCRSSPESAIDADQASAVAELAKRVEHHFGHPQDIEWATAGGTLYLLQSRPITVLPDEPPEPIPVPVEPPPGFWWRDVSHMPKPLYPMTRSIFLDPEVMPAGFHRVNEEFGLLMDGMEMKEIGGWVYQRLVPLGGKDHRPPPPWLMWLMARVVPPIHNRLKNAARALHDDTAGQYVQRWHSEWRPGLKVRMQVLRSVNLPALSDGELDRQLTTLLGFIRECWDIHMKVHGGLMLLLGELAFACRDLLGWDDRQMLELLRGLSEKSSEPARRLAALAQMVRERPPVLDLLDRLDARAVERLAEVDREFADAFAAYLKEFGGRALRYEVAELTLEETPALLLKLLRDQVLRGHDPYALASSLEEQRQEAVARARAVLADRSPEDRERFERALARAERAYPTREDSEFYTASVPLALVRYAVLDLGRRLADRGLIARRDNVFFLEMEEAGVALRHGGDRRALVARRKAERAWVEAHPGPASYGKEPGPPPSFAPLPLEARFIHEAMMWNYERIFAPSLAGKAPATAGQISGIPASPGTYTGPVRVILSETEFGKLQPGDVLVCPITSPVWSVLFPSVGALVTDTGGILSHSAIIAREYRVPAVVATGNATQLLRDNQRVTVKGQTGIVEVNQ